MKRKKLLLLLASTCLVLVLAVSPFMAACAAPAVEPGVAPEVAALEKEVAALEKKVTAAEKGEATSEKEVAALEKKIAAAEKEIAAAEKEIAELKKPVPAKKYKFRLQSSVVRGTPGGKTFDSVFVPLLEELSQGQIEVKWFDLKTLVPNKEALSACETGVIDMWFGGSGYYKGALGIVANFTSGVPAMYRNYTEFRTIWYDLGLFDLQTRAYEPFNVYYFCTFRTSLDTYIVSTEPIESLEDLRQMMLRAYGSDANLWEKLGVSTCYVPGGELYTSLATGVIDAFEFGGPGYNWPYGFHEIAKYRFGPTSKASEDTNWSSPCDMLINGDRWEELSFNLQMALRTACWRWEPAIARRYAYEAGGAVSKMIADFGVTFNPIPEADLAEIAAVVPEVWEELAENDPMALEALEILKDYHKYLGRL